MTLYIAHNCALSTTTGIGAGTSYASGAKVALQLGVPDNASIRIVEIGWTQDIATSTATLLEVATTDTATTLTAHSTTTVKPLLERDARSSSLTMSTTGTGYGSASITSNTTLRPIHKLYVPQQYVYQYPLGQWPIVGAGTGENFVQLRVNTTATVNALAWIIWDEA
ncbi:hypothetical protein [Streptomyces sp. I8-5]|uniref:hypothetical protein n=1 Tax=Streptomyces sp. I8-5 TaxID=3104277 RepID=UPI00386BD42D